jgi:hypothetical protein
MTPKLIHLSRTLLLGLVIGSATLLAQPLRILTEDESRVKALGFSREASHWIITEGLSEWYEREQDNVWLLQHLVRTYFVSLDSIGGPFKDLYKMRVILTTGIVIHDVISLFGVLHSGDYYEYWVIKELGNLVEVPNTRFLVTKAADEFSHREILLDRNTFFSIYEEDGVQILKFPMENLANLSAMEIEKFPTSYEGTELEGYIVDARNYDRYELRKMNFIERIRYRK